MKINMNLELIKEIYGEDIIDIIQDNIDIIEDNAETLKKYNFKDIEGIFERYQTLFINFPEQFEKKIETLKKKYGENFADIIENDLSILETIDE